MQRRISRKTILFAIVTLVIIATVLFLFLVPQGSYVYVLVEVDESSLNITQCALKKSYPISLLSPEDSVTVGNRAILLRVFHNKTEILQSERRDIGTGNCVLQTAPLPDDIPINSELLIKVELYGASNETIAETQTILVYK